MSASRPRPGVLLLGVVAFLLVAGQLRGKSEAEMDWPHAEPLSVSAPARISIPAIEVSAPVTTVGMQRNGQMAVPDLDRADQAGWFRHGPTPGEPGPAVIIGHLDSKTGPAIFYRIRELKKGDVITVTRRDGKQVRFAVSGIDVVGKTTFPAEKVYRDVDTPELRLISCGGRFDHVRQSYSDNVIVYAKLE